MNHGIPLLRYKLSSLSPNTAVNGTTIAFVITGSVNCGGGSQLVRRGGTHSTSASISLCGPTASTFMTSCPPCPGGCQHASPRHDRSSPWVTNVPVSRYTVVVSKFRFSGASMRKLPW
jgi:hypothetical protein